MFQRWSRLEKSLLFGSLAVILGTCCIMSLLVVSFMSPDTLVSTHQQLTDQQTFEMNVEVTATPIVGSAAQVDTAPTSSPPPQLQPTSEIVVVTPAPVPTTVGSPGLELLSPSAPEQRKLAWWPFMIIGVFLILLGWAEVWHRMQTSDLMAPILTILFASIMMFVQPQMALLFFAIGLGITFLSCRLGGTDYSPLGFFFGIIGIELLIFDHFDIRWLQLQFGLAVIVLMIGAAITSYELVRTKEQVQDIGILIVLIFLDLAGIAMGIMIGQPLLGLMILHSVLMLLIIVIENKIVDKIRMIKGLLAKAEFSMFKIPSLDVVILDNYIVIFIAIALMAWW